MQIQIPNVLPPQLAPYAKAIYATVSAAVAGVILAALSKYLGIDVDTELLPGAGVTWSQAVNAAVPIVFVFGVPNGAQAHQHDSPTSVDDDGRTTLGTDVAALEDAPAGPRGEPTQA